MGLGQSGCGSGQVDLYFSHEFFYYKENIYLPVRKSCDKLLDVNFEFTVYIKNELN